MSANNFQFVQTKNMFREYLSGYSKSPNFDEWNSAANDDKAALLYVTFYQEITLAWYNAVNANGVVHVTQEDGVSTVMQYLMKNVSKISEDQSRYTAKYIYKVCYNCLLSLWKTRGADMRRSECEISNEYINAADNVAVNLWDLVPSEDEDFETQQVKEAIWNVIKHMGPKAEKVVNHLINPSDTIYKVSRSSSEYPLDSLADVSVTKEEYEQIVEELKVKLAPFKDALLTM